MHGHAPSSLQEHQEGRTDLVVNDTNPKQSVHIYKCSKSTVRVEGKVNEILLGAPPAHVTFSSRPRPAPLYSADAHAPAPTPRLLQQTTATSCSSSLTTPSAASTLSTARGARSRSRARRRRSWCVRAYRRVRVRACRVGPDAGWR